METRINVAELLKNCPSGMKLDCAMFENLYFDYIDDSLNNPYPILCYGKTNEARNVVRFSKYGTYTLNSNAKCVIFPKDKTTWEGFVPPVEFKDGDIVAAIMVPEGLWIGIFKQDEGTTFEVYCSLNTLGEFHNTYSRGHALAYTRLATEEEKDKLFKVIKDNGYKWNAEKKCLEKLELQYPKTYKECCDILGLDTMENDAQGYKRLLIMRVQKLIICRDAYWMGFIGGPWCPIYEIDEDGTGTFKFCIKNMGGKIEMVETVEANTILAFPTAEMRDAFYKNFKESIERSKELL